MTDTPAARFELQILVRVTPESGRPHLGEAADVSESGIQVELERPIDVGTSVIVGVFPPGQREPLNLTGQVMRSDGRKHGIRFVGLYGQSRDALREFLGVLRRRQPGRG